MESEKPTLLQLRRDYNKHTDTPITSKQIAEKAAVSQADEFLMELGCPVNAAIANRVINAFNTITGKQYTFNEMKVSLKKDDLDLRRYERGLAR
jgi:hypothetical protein